MEEALGRNGGRGRWSCLSEGTIVPQNVFSLNRFSDDFETTVRGGINRLASVDSSVLWLFFGKTKIDSPFANLEIPAVS